MNIHQIAPLRPTSLRFAGLRGGILRHVVIGELWLATLLRLWTMEGQARSSPQRAKCGGAEGTRTPNPLLAKQVLYQLSYSPMQES